MLHWNTVNPLLKECLYTLMEAEPFTDFRLVGGTALSLHLGHRMSVDIDLFTDALYDTVDFDAIDRFLLENFSYTDVQSNILPGMGKSYFIGTAKDNLVKLDVYYSTEPFIQPIQEIEGIRMATVEEIIAMKVDVVARGGRKKDFWDLHELLPNYNVTQMLALHKYRHEWTHNEDEVLRNFTDFKRADQDFDPICLKRKFWEFIKDDISEATKKHIKQVE
jgi:predicted nucleotidyltransferase component of viral defense system